MGKKAATAPMPVSDTSPMAKPPAQETPNSPANPQPVAQAEQGPVGNKSAKRQRTEELEFWDNVPYIDVSFELYNDVLMEALNRNIGRLPLNAHLVEGLPLAREWDDVVELMEIKLDTMFSAVETRLAEEQRAADLLIERLGIDTWPKYTRPRQFTMRQTTPRVGHYISLLRKADNFLIKIELLHLTGSIKRDELKKQRKEWKSILTKLANRVDGEANRVRSALKRKSHKQRTLVGLMNDGVTEVGQGAGEISEEEIDDAEQMA